MRKSPSTSPTARGGLRAAAAAGSAALLLAAGSGTAQAEPRPHGELPGNWTYLAVMQGDEAFGDLKGRMLTCPAGEDDGAAADTACTVLEDTKGDISRAEPLNTACTKIYKPVTAVAYGVWDGRRRVFAQNFPNECVMKDRTGGVFGAVE